ncbi:MAG: glycosyltransferase family A protein [Ginsengibacter sp.]
MNEAPLISVIIPFLNPGEWLAEAINSVLSQTYKNYEIILIDDGSVRQDSDVALQYAKKFPESILYIEHAGHINRGLTISRNVGIAHSKGELVAFLDADDCWLPGKLENQLAIFRNFPEVQMICEASLFWYSWKNENSPDEIILIGAPQGIYQPTELMSLLYPLGEGQPPCPSGIIIKREALQRSGGFEESFSGVYQLYEDQAFLSKIYSKEAVYISGEANNLYRKREDSMSSAANDANTYNKVRLFYLAWLRKYLAATHSSDVKMTKLLSDFQQRLTVTDYALGITL